MKIYRDTTCLTELEAEAYGVISLCARSLETEEYLLPVKDITFGALACPLRRWQQLSSEIASEEKAISERKNQLFTHLLAISNCPDPSYETIARYTQQRDKVLEVASRVMIYEAELFLGK